MANWWDDLPTFADRNELRDFVAHRKDGGEDEPSAVAEAEQMQPEQGPAPSVPALDGVRVMEMIRHRKGVPGATEGEVQDSRINQMRHLSIQHMQMYAAREQIESGKVKLQILNDKGEVQAI